MIVLDVNVVLGVQRRDHSTYGVARPWFDRLLATGGSFGVPSQIWVSFVRLTTDFRVVGVPTPHAEVFGFLHEVMAQPGYVPAEPGPRHLAIFEEVCHRSDAQGSLVPDAFLAAVAIENAATVASFDRDFARFDGLEWVIPAAP